MKQLVQDYDSGEVRMEDVPAPAARPGGVRVRTTQSVVSVGTERMRVEFGRKSILGKALERPDHVRTVLDAVRREGLVSTYRKVKSRLSELAPMGYSSAGVVESVGEGVAGPEVGSLVACAGAGYANHAERAWVPKNLTVPVPEGVEAEHAAFATLGAIALQGVRQADVRLGECVAVIGLGILGQLTVQLLRAAGVRVVGIDLDPDRVRLAARHGAAGVARSDDVEGRVRQETDGIGADAVIITAATSSDDPIRLAGTLARDRGAVVVVGAVPIDVPRSSYYEKELEVRLSRSYGPGRYDTEYEEKGHDYPVGWVRWTERRNMGEFLRLLAAGEIELAPLITHRFDFADAEAAYELVTGDEGKNALGVVLEYPEEPAPEPGRIAVDPGARARDVGVMAGRESVGGRDRGAVGRRGSDADGDADGETGGAASVVRVAPDGRVRIGLIGAGNFATGTLLPLLKKLDVAPRGVVTAGGVSARNAADRFDFDYLAGSPDELLADPEIDAVVVATRHGQHARLAGDALRAGKAVFVEKPLALDEAELDDVLRAARAADRPLMVGFNRRFAPATRFLLRRFEGAAGARVVHVRANAGAIPADHWVHDPEAGGGRLVGEGCHFIDLALFLAGSPPVDARATALGGPDPDAELGDNVQVSLRCADGSLASVLYTAKGDERAGKERVELYAGGRTGVIDDFRLAAVWADGRKRWKGRQDKGHAGELEAFVDAVRTGGPAPIPIGELEASSRATLRAAASLRGEPAAPE